MRLSRHDAPTVNAGSMADIAFLLLIFFLVTTTISTDEGISRKLPKYCLSRDCSETVNERNVLRVVLNSKNEIFVENDLIQLEDLKDMAKSFLDNNGDGTCSYCNGKNLKDSSDNPKEAVVSLQNDKLTSYGFYIAVQDELTKAYYELRETYSNSVLHKNSNSLSKDELSEVKDAYPFNLSEAETK